MRFSRPHPTWRGTALAALVVLLGAGLTGGLLRVRVDTGTDSFLPPNDPTLAAVERKARDFGGDPVIVVLRYPAPRQFLTDHDQLLGLLRLEGQLGRLPDVATVYGPATVLNQLAGAAQDFLIQIAGTRDGLREAAGQAAERAGKSPGEVTAAANAASARFDLSYAPLVVRGLPVGLPTLSNPRFGATVMFGPDGLSKPQWRFLIPAPDTVAILVRPRQDLEGAATQRLVDGIRHTVVGAGLATSAQTISGVPTVTAELTAEVTHEAPVIGGLVALVVLLRFLVLPAPGVGVRSGPGSRRVGPQLRPLVSSVLGSASTLALFGWCRHPLSVAAVLLLPLLLGVGSSFPLYLATVPNRRRVVVMSLGSTLAFAALALSPLPFVRDLGIALATGILLTVAAALVLGARPVSPELASGTTLPAGPMPRATVRVATLASASVVALLGWLALPGLGVLANPMELASGLPALSDAEAVESVLGASGEVDVELAGPDVLSPEALAWTRAAQHALETRGDLQTVTSVADLLGFLGPSPTPEQVSAALELLPTYLSSSVVRPDHRLALLVFGVRMQDLGAQQRMLTDVRAMLPPPPPGYRADLVGLPVAAAHGYQLLMRDRYLANLAGIVAAGLVLTLGLRKRGDATRAVAASALAAGWGLAMLWLLGAQMSPLTVALGSLVTVTACEFVVVLTEAERRAYRWLHTSVMYACLTSVLGYLLLAASRLWLVREFGLVMAAAVMLSYLSARLMVWLFPPVVSAVSGVCHTPSARPPEPAKALA